MGGVCAESVSVIAVRVWFVRAVCVHVCECLCVCAVCVYVRCVCLCVCGV